MIDLWTYIAVRALDEQLINVFMTTIETTSLPPLTGWKICVPPLKARNPTKIMNPPSAAT